MGNEFRVNTYQASGQDSPGVMSFADGSFLIVWRSYYFDTSTYYIGGQYFDARGNFVGGEKVMDASAGSASEPSSLRVLADGAFAMSFSFSFDGLLDTDQTYVKIFEPGGAVRNAGVRVDNLPVFQSGGGAVAANKDGGFTVFFTVDNSNSTNRIDFDDIFGQRFDKNGTKIGGNFRVNTKEHELDQRAVDVVELENNNNLVYWHSVSSFDYPNGGYSNEFRASLYSATGKLLRSDFSLGDSFGNTRSSLGASDITALDNGGFAFARYELETSGPGDSVSELLLRTYDAAGRMKINDVRIAASTQGIIYSTSIAQLASGELALVWEQPAKVNKFDNQNNIYGQILTATGKKLGSSFLVSTAQGGEQTGPVIEALAGGGFVVTYQSEAADDDSEGIAARIYGRGTSGADTVTVDSSGVFSGFGGNDKIAGNSNANFLSGGSGDDRLWGRWGNDRLYGGTGSDTFYFSSSLSAKSNVDRISDFTHDVDHLALAGARFGALGAGVTASEFRLGTSASDSNDHLIYDKQNGKLYYDADGKGGAKAVLFVDLKDGTVLDSGDFLIV
jgi:Ca2+-binding RTX toxin-like protein